MRLPVFVGLSALVILCSIGSVAGLDNFLSQMSKEMKKHEDITKNKTLSELASEIMHETRAIGHDIVGYVKKTVGVKSSNSTANETDASADNHRQSRMLDILDYFVPSLTDMERAARSNPTDTSFTDILAKITGINAREERAEEAEAADKVDEKSSNDTASVKSGYGGSSYPQQPANYNPAPVYSAQQMAYRPPQNNYQQPPPNNYQSYSTPAPYTTPSTPYYSTTPYYTTTTPYYTTPSTTTTTPKPAKPILIPIPGPPGPPGKPGLPGLPGLPGKTPSLAGLKAILMTKLAKLSLLIKAVALICLLKFGGLLGLILGLVLPLYGKLKKAGVVLPVEEATESYGHAGYAPARDYAAPQPSNDYGAPAPSGSFAPLNQYAVDDATSNILPSIDAAGAKYAAPQPSYSAPQPSYDAPRPVYSAPSSKVKNSRNRRRR